MDLAERDDWEEELARVTGRALRKQYANVRRALGSNPSVDKLTPAMFETMRAELQAAIRPVLERVYLAHAEALTHEFPRTKQGIGIDWGIINERAATWSSKYSFDLVTGITNTTRNTLQAQISDFFRDARTLKDLENTLSNLFGPVRAAMIAQTEVTRAASAAEEAYAEELRRLGLNVTFRWITENDEIVQRCPICWPRHETLQGDGWQELPPAHPRCRCWTNSVVLSEPVRVRAVLKAETNTEGYAILYLDDVEGLQHAQQRAAQIAHDQGLEFEIVPRNELHITLVYARNVNNGTLEQIGLAVKLNGINSLGLGSDSIEWFGDDDTRKALVHRIYDDKLAKFQQRVYSLFKQFDADSKMELSEFSNPDKFNAHVTIGYGPEFDFPSEDVEFKSSNFVVARDDYMNVVEVTAG